MFIFKPFRLVASSGSVNSFRRPDAHADPPVGAFVDVPDRLAGACGHHRLVLVGQVWIAGNPHVAEARRKIVVIPAQARHAGSGGIQVRTPDDGLVEIRFTNFGDPDLLAGGFGIRNRDIGIEQSIAVTKLDGTAKGGVVIGISDQFKIPVKYIGLGEGIEDLQVFRKKEFVDSLFGGNA